MCATSLFFKFILIPYSMVSFGRLPKAVSLYSNVGPHRSIFFNTPS